MERLRHRSTSDGVHSEYSFRSLAEWATTRERAKSGLLRRRAVAAPVLDQALSSFSNYVVAILIAATGSARDLGIYAIVASTYGIALATSRSVLGDCLLAPDTGSSVSPAERSRRGFYACGAVSLGLAAPVLIASTLAHGDLAVALGVLGLALPGLLLQDFARYVGFSEFRPSLAVGLDAGWLVLFAAAATVIAGIGKVDLVSAFCAWAFSGSALGVAAFVRWTDTPLALWTSTRAWFADEWPTGSRFLGEATLNTLSANLGTYLLVGILDLGAVGRIRLAQIALGPLAILVTGIQQALIPRFAGWQAAGSERIAHRLGLVSAGVAVTSVVWATAIWACPSWITSPLFGSQFHATRGLILLIGAGYAIGGLATGATIGLRALRLASQVVRARALAFPVTLVAPLLGAQLAGTTGYGVGFIIAAVMTSATFAWLVKSNLPRSNVLGGSV